MSADQTPGAPTEQEWGEALARAMYVEVPTETWQAFDASASRDAAARVAPALRPLIAREREAAKAEVLRTEADLIGNGTCCGECDAVANMMRDRADAIAREAPSAFIDGDPLADEIIREAQQDGDDRG